MRVDIGRVLHVLAHELRTPAGIAQGYLRLLIEERLPDPAERRRALEQAQKALTRVSDLTRESTELANWMGTDRSSVATLAAGALVERAVAAAALSPLPEVRVDAATATAGIATVDADALVGAVSTFLKATARELRSQVCTIQAHAQGAHVLDVLMGPADKLETLADGPDAPHADPLGLERGGLGLALVTAAVVLEAHSAIGWTSNASRTTVGIRFPLKEERALP